MVLIFGLFFNTCRPNLFFSFLSTLAAPSLLGNLTWTQWYPVFLPNRDDHNMAPGRAYLSQTAMVHTRPVETLHVPDCLRMITSDTSTTAGPAKEQLASHM